MRLHLMGENKTYTPSETTVILSRTRRGISALAEIPREYARNDNRFQLYFEAATVFAITDARETLFTSQHASHFFSPLLEARMTCFRPVGSAIAASALNV